MRPFRFYLPGTELYHKPSGTKVIFLNKADNTYFVFTTSKETYERYIKLNYIGRCVLEANLPYVRYDECVELDEMTKMEKALYN